MRLVVPGFGLGIVRMTMPVAVPMIATAQQPGAGDIHGEPQTGDWNGFGEMDRHRRKDAGYRFIADQDCDHRQDDRAGETCQVAELAGSEAEPLVIGVLAGIGVGQCREQQRAGMGTHVQPISDQRDRAEDEAADDLGDHHCTAQPDDDPGLALTLLMGSAEEDMRVAVRRRRVIGHGRSSLPIGLDA